jgi:Neuraminyllactose-binding hemagglutinin precursor (NLBH)
MLSLKIMATIALAGTAVAQYDICGGGVKCAVPNPIVFDYASPNSAAAGSAHLTIGLVNPTFQVSGMSGDKLSKKFTESIGKDLEEMLNAKGFKIQGPFTSIDEMTYSEKQKCDFVMEVAAIPEIQAFGKYATTGDGKYQQIGYRFSGTGSLTGKINMVLYEPMSREKVWTKSVVIPAVENIVLQECQSYTNQTLSIDDPNIYNEVGKALQDSYKGILAKVDSHISVEDWNRISRPAKKP